MGFMDYSIVGSDNASGFAFEVANAVAHLCEKEIKKKGNRYNTPGFINVALLIEELTHSPEVFAINEKMVEVAKKTFAELDRYVASHRANRMLWDEQNKLRGKNKKVAKTKEAFPPISEFDLRRLDRIHTVLRRYIEDANV